MFSFLQYFNMVVNKLDNYIVSEVIRYINVNTSSCFAMAEELTWFYDFTFVLSGSMTYVADGKEYVLKKNDAIFLKPGTMRSRYKGTEPVKYVSFNFHILPGAEFPFDDFIKNCISPDIKKIVAAFPQNELSSRYHTPQKLANLLNYMLFEVLDVTSLKSNNEHVIKILRYIEENITENLSLQMVSEKVNLTKEYTSYIFKKEMNNTLTNYINERKMLYAKKLISDGEMRLSEIASHLGYNNYHYFSYLFKKHFNISPIAFKNKA